MGSVVIYSYKEDRSRTAFAAQEDTVVQILVVVVVVCYQTQKEGMCQLEVDPLTDDVHLIHFISAFFLAKHVIPEIVVQAKVRKRLQGEAESQGDFITQVRIFITVYAAAERIRG